ncbi:LysR family transcriptional regulator [Paenibacillus hemerocallicola]|uniref:LysR family transcriptional regulator n=1 Tax=Paenibacillus hemerocallicola TaxID=1172614 RepID=A0A5C4T2K3_9BACL|nr:LysR family transcriptional regulator [Paenibacillus hemerocallicola]TNJ62970.1 LysR family transcriptional regulator [Paenibacillus hemerocallicola]
MEWQQLEYFHTVARVEHFTRAAELLSVSQSALSRSISKLEEELGVKLFERKGRGVVLNRYGKEFYAKTSRSLQELAQAKQEMIDLLDPERGTVSLAFLKSLGASFVPNLVSAFLGSCPRVHFQLFQNATSVMLDQLEAGDIDFCLSTVTETRASIEWQPLWTEDIFAFVPVGHELGNRRQVSLQELADSRVIALKQGYGTRTVMDRLYDQAGITPKIMFEGEEVVTLMGFVRAKLGITLLPDIKGVDMEGIVRLPVDEPECRRTIGLAWNKNSYLSPVANRFRQFLTEYSGGLTLAE